jgi:uncharacterized membrane protein YphA (DoxX/SURF4 family)
MSESFADSPDARSLDELSVWTLPRWKTYASHGAAILIALLFLVSGLWKITDPLGWTIKIEQFKVPYSLSLPFTILLAIGETWGAMMILVPRFRRWGAWLLSFLLIAFMVYMGIHYTEFRNMDCSCFPLLKRAVGPGFFISDFAMLVLAGVAGWWAPPSTNLRAAAVALGAVAVFAGVCYGVAASRVTGTPAPASIVADGQPFSLEHGRIFLYFYDPECMHCDAAARKMSKMKWGGTKVVALPTRQKQFAGAFLNDTGLRAVTCLEHEPLKQLFPFDSTPYGVILENGRQTGAISRFDDAEPGESLRKAGLVLE